MTIIIGATITPTLVELSLLEVVSLEGAIAIVTVEEGLEVVAVGVVVASILVVVKCVVVSAVVAAVVVVVVVAVVVVVVVVDVLEYTKLIRVNI